METAICAENLTLKYRTPIRRRSIRSLDFFSAGDPVRRITALKDVSFSVKKGEVLGIIGDNGSGKSTLLKVFAGVVEPDAGHLSIYGKPPVLLSLGLGFHPELSGADNIYLSGMLLGFSRREIQEKYREILAFSELGNEVFRPVRTYSSGMYARLAFSVAVMLRPDILLLDEVLAVGDLVFRRKSYEKLLSMIREEGTTALIVSHNLNLLQGICHRVLWLDRGQVRKIGPPEEVIGAYREANSVPLPTPAVAAIACGGSVQLFWNGVDRALDYRVYRKAVEPGGRWEILCDGCRDTGFTDVPPAGDREYRYAVRARVSTPLGPVWTGFVPSGPVRPEK